MARKLLHVSMIVDASIIHELLMLITGKAIGAPEIKPVQHGGEAGNGELRDRPKTSELIMALANSRASFTTAELNAEGEKYGHATGALSQALYKLLNAGALKRVAPATYSTKGKHVSVKMGRPSKDAQAVLKNLKDHAKAAKPSKPPTGIPGKILDAMKHLQNGSGEGVMLGAIKVAIGKKHTDSISPQMTTLVRRGFLKRVGDAAYRVA